MISVLIFLCAFIYVIHEKINKIQNILSDFLSELEMVHKKSQELMLNNIKLQNEFRKIQNKK